MNMNKLVLSAVVLCMTLFIVSCKETGTNEVSKASTEVVETASNNVKVVALSDNESIKVNTPKNTKASLANEMTWYGMGEVEEMVKKAPKKVIVDVYTQWCGPCKMMDRNTFSDEAVQKAINEKFYPVKFDAEGADDIVFQGKTYGNPNHDPNRRGRNSSHELSPFFSVRGYPTLVVLDENFNVLHKLVGYKTPDKLLAEIEAI